MPNLIGKSLGRYHILEQLGEGGMAIVYKAYDTHLERDVAIKVIRNDAFPPNQLERILKRFEREAKALARLSHPNIVKVHDYGKHEGAPYLVMEYLPGGNLKARLGNPIPWQEAVKTLLPIAEALDYAHENKIIHRDIKPSNILLTEKGAPMLTDFGIAKILESEAETATLTGTGIGVGTPEYMAPEQWTGQTSPQSDIYSLGVVLYEMVTGRKPYQADTPVAIYLKQSTEPLPRPKKFISNLSEDAEKVLLKALAKRPEDRYQTSRGMVRALEVLRDNSAPKPRREVKMPINLKRVTMALGAGALIIMAIIELSPLIKTKPSNPPANRTLPASVPPSSTKSKSSTVVQTNETAALTITSTESYSSTPPLLPDEITDSKGVLMVLVPVGDFIMGSAENQPYDAPSHSVFLDNYYMDKFEVTNSAYKTCVEAQACDLPIDTSRFSDPKYADHPVTWTSWEMSKEFCEWRETRLPTEAEWEKAARGTDGNIYPWGNGLDWTGGINICGLANFSTYRGACVGNTTPKGSYENGKSHYDAYDMLGNVWEWVADWYDDSYYRNSPTNNPLGPETGRFRTARGGAWSDETYYNRTYYRLWLEPDYSSNIVGFRCAKNAQSTPQAPTQTPFVTVNATPTAPFLTFCSWQEKDSSYGIDSFYSYEFYCNNDTCSGTVTRRLGQTIDTYTSEMDRSTVNFRVNNGTYGKCVDK